MKNSKRAATRELNHDNWNEEEEGEEAGEFKKASTEDLERRVIKIAKRRAGDSDNSPGTNPFSNFGGFKTNTGLTASTPMVTNQTPFSFLAKIPSGVAPKTNGSVEKSSTPSSSNEYLSKVKALNIAVADWIKSHIDENPLCILTPIFDDYRKYLKEFEALKASKESATPRSTESEPKSALTPPSNNFSFGKPAVQPSLPSSSQSGPQFSNTSSSTASNVFNNFKFGDQKTVPTSSPPKGSPATTTTNNKDIPFGITAVGPQPTSVAPTFSFGLQSSSSTSASLFGGFTNTSSTFSFANTVQASQPDVPKSSNDEEADEEPPKNEFVPVVEDDSLYSKRCKVFVKGSSDFVDRGVGTLYIKKVDDSKYQLIVRADTNLGNILLNIMIVEGLPVNRFGKNNVMIVCIPTPDAKPPPTSVLVRVKTGEEADELFDTINKYKK